MCTGIEIAALIGATAAVGTSAYTIAQGKPKTPTPTQATKDPNVDAFRRQNQSALAPGAAAAGGDPTLLGGSGTGNVGTSTLLGQ